MKQVQSAVREGDWAFQRLDRTRGEIDTEEQAAALQAMATSTGDLSAIANGLSGSVVRFKLEG